MNTSSNSRKVRARLCVIALAVVTPIIMLACGGGGGGGGDSGSAVNTSAATTPAAIAAPAPQTAAASVTRILEVPDALKDAPFDSEKSLLVPPGFGIRVWARVPQARFMALAPNGDVLVSRPGSGSIALLRDRANNTPEQFTFASGLQNPHDMVFHQIGDVTWLYIAESNRISRVAYKSGDTAIGERQVLIDGLPDDSTSELQGRYGHQLKNLALSPDHKLYVSIASTCNACTEDVNSNPVRGAIYQYNAEGKEGRLYARGLRNAEGLDVLPNGQLWVAVNNRDEILVPKGVDVDGDGKSDEGQSLASYVDNNPPEPFTAVRDGGNYGWPFCNARPNASMSNLESSPDYEFNRDSQNLDCATVDKPSKGIRAHAAPLGLSLLHNTAAPAAYRKGAAIALHGCWNCSTLGAGYKVVYFPFDDNGNAGNEIDLITGFVTDPVGRALWGRPVDVIADSKGNLLVSDDYAGAIYQLYPK